MATDSRYFNDGHLRLEGPEHDEPVISTRHVYPPIPLRQFDWCAWYGDADESTSYGWGRTEEEAIADLRENVEP